MTSSEQLIHYRVCNLCEAMCGLEIKHDGQKVHSIKGDKEDPFSQGHVCPKAVALDDIYKDPDRLKKPVKRTGGEWREISWQEAFEEIGKKIIALQSKHGNDSIALYLGNPTVHNYGSLLFHENLVKALKTKNTFSATSVDQLPHHFAANFMFGHSLLIPVPDIDRTDHMIIMGANPLASNGSLMSAAGVDKRLKKIQARGGKIVVIDPRRTETAEMADEHHFISPGEDVFLLLAMLHVIFDKGMIRLSENEIHAKGLPDLKKAISEYDPQNMAQRIGIPAIAIEKLATEFAEAKKAVCYGRMGLSTQVHGGLCQWLINVLNIVTGHFDTAGGAMFTTPAVPLIRGKNSKNNFGRWKSRVRGLPEFNGELPVSVLAEDILQEGKGQIKALITNAGNPVLSTPNGKQLDRALTGLEFMVSIDIYINETTRHADIILPPATGLEVDHYDLVFNALAVRNTAKYSPPLFKPESGTRYDWQIFKELGKRISGKLSFIDRFATPTRMLDLALRFGPYGSFGKISNLFSGLNLKMLKSHEHGFDLGPLQPQLSGILKTSDKQINLTPKILLDRLMDVTKEFMSSSAKEEPDQFMLIGRRHVRSNNSWMHNVERLMKGKNRCALMMNEEDARNLKVTDHQEVRLSSRVGEVVVPIEISNKIMPGVVSLPHGYGHGREGIRMAIAKANAGASINDLTDDQQIDPLTGNAAFSGQRVRISPIS
jgi:anaerobic selenocysteine-containing dehydrogenase